MKVLIVGGGGREHALAWKIAQSPKLKKLYSVPGNVGMAELGECVKLNPTDVEEIAEFAEKQNIDFVVVGPEAPLAAGIADALIKRKILVFGPKRRAAEIESSKAFARRLMKKHNIPGPNAEIFATYQAAKAYITEAKMPLVIKVDGLASGKGAFVCFDREEANDVLEQIMREHSFGDAGNRVVVEEYLEGEEVSFFALTDGTTIMPLETVQDYKRVFDNDMGPNTGGMGSYSPVPFVTKELYEDIEKKILIPTVHAMRVEGRSYKGVLYAGLMLTKDGPKVLEFNARFGDPEMQVLVLRLKSDILELLQLCAEERLAEAKVEWGKGAAVCVVLASGGYPGKYEVGYPIKGLKDVSKMKDVVVFHAGTELKNGEIVTAGGRVLGVGAYGKDIKEAQQRAYEAVSYIKFNDMHYRSDIAEKAL
jgi:phosphoribosylamine--glycine ligase